ncbi:MAG: hypothetical protein A2142_02200 [candidate division Zixibacteria bacterium RBG_16_48_11]|nr:MAG: hypothetical protein A2142_02200 [candidate division Zixibacteria bacterium RBG_16_48_11]
MRDYIPAKNSNMRLQLARQLRRSMTLAEKKLWSLLRQNKLGAHFRRQVPIGPYVADFYSRHAKLVLEVDGSQHLQEEHIQKDIQRKDLLEKRGYRILRFNNLEVLNNPQGVMQEIIRHLRKDD